MIKKSSLRRLIILMLILTAGHLEISPIKRRHWIKQDNCTVPTQGCVPIPPEWNQSCLGNPLPYDLTSDYPLTEDVSLSDLKRWSVMKAVPACWDKLQFFLCAVYMPECREEIIPMVDGFPLKERFVAAFPDNNKFDSMYGSNKFARIVLPEEEMCLSVHKACPILFSDDINGYELDIENGSGFPKQNNRIHRLNGLLGSTIPKFLKCANYVHGCRQNKLTSSLFQVVHTECPAPLVSTSSRRNWIKGISSCSFACHRPIFRPTDYALARTITLYASVFGILVNLLVLLTLHLLHTFRSSTVPPCTNLIPYEEGKHQVMPKGKDCPPSAFEVIDGFFRLPYTALLYIHIYFFVGCVGWVIPHLPGIDDSVACRSDGSVRVGEFQLMTGKSIYCLVTFVMVYFPLLAALMWSIVLDYAIYSTFRKLNMRAGCLTLLNLNSASVEEIHPLHRSSLWRTDTRVTPSLSSNLVKSVTARGSVSPHAPLIVPDSCDMKKRHGWPRVVQSKFTENSLEKHFMQSGTENVALECAPSPFTGSPVIRVPDNGPLGEVSCESLPTEVKSPCNFSIANEQYQHLSANLKASTQLSESLANQSFQYHPITCRLLRPYADTLNAEYSIFGLDTPSNQIHSPSRIHYARMKNQRSLQGFNNLTTSSKLTCTHIVVPAIAGIFTVISLVTSEIDGEPLSGLCFVGVRTLWAHCTLVLVPLSFCLLVKVGYLCRAISLISGLSRRLSTSFFAVDREMANRLRLCIWAYVIYLFVLASLLIFFVGVHFYVHFGEPRWIETQRAFLFCQLRHKLMGYETLIASLACQSSYSTIGMQFDGAKRDSSPLFHSLRDSNSSHSLNLTGNPSTFSSRGGDSELMRILREIPARQYNTPISNSENSFLSPQFDLNPPNSDAVNPYAPRPFVGPILLNLVTYFLFNLVFSTMCLLDSSARKCWLELARRIAVLLMPSSKNRKNQSKLLENEEFPFPNRNSPHNFAFVCEHSYHVSNNKYCQFEESPECYTLPPSFSWWDPGVFFLYLPVLKTPTGVPLQTDISQTKLATTASNDPASYCSGHSPMSRNYSKPTVISCEIAKTTCSEISFRCSRRYSSSTNDESCVAQASAQFDTSAIFNNGCPVGSGLYSCANQDEGFHKSNSVNSSQSLFLRYPMNNKARLVSSTRRNHQQVKALSSLVCGSDSKANIATNILDHLTLLKNDSAAVNSLPFKPTPMDINAQSLASFAAAAIQHTLSRSSRRCRHRRLFSGKSSNRRRLYSRSLSTTGFSIGDRSSLRGFHEDLMCSALHASTSNSVTNLRRSVDALQGNSLAASLSLLLAPYSLNSGRNPFLTAPSFKGRLSSHSFSINPLDSASHTTSTFGESQQSASSLVSECLTARHFPNKKTDDSLSKGATATWRQMSAVANALPGFSRVCDRQGVSAGSRLSLRSLSCASSMSSDAQSYNSFHLLAEQAGASWRELWRTRILLMDVLRWAQAVSVGATPLGCPATAFPGGKDASNLMTTTGAPFPEPSNAPVPEDDPTLDWTNHVTALVMHFLNQMHQQQKQQQDSCVNAHNMPSTTSNSPQTGFISPSHFTVDPSILAALVAATAAASVAIQQQRPTAQELSKSTDFRESNNYRNMPLLVTNEQRETQSSPVGRVNSSVSQDITSEPINSIAPWLPPYALSTSSSQLPIPASFSHSLSYNPLPSVCLTASTLTDGLNVPKIQPNSDPAFNKFHFHSQAPPDLVADHGFREILDRKVEVVCHLDAGVGASTPILYQLQTPAWPSDHLSPNSAMLPPGLRAPAHFPIPQSYQQQLINIPATEMLFDSRRLTSQYKWAGIPFAEKPILQTTEKKQMNRPFPSVTHSWSSTSSPNKFSTGNFRNADSHRLTSAPSNNLIHPGNQTSAVCLPYPTDLEFVQNRSQSDCVNVLCDRKKKQRRPALSRDDSDAFDSEDEVISDTDGKSESSLNESISHPSSSRFTRVSTSGGMSYGDYLIESKSLGWVYPVSVLDDEVDSIGFSSVFDCVEGSIHIETEEEDCDISSVSQSASQVIPHSSRSPQSSPIANTKQLQTRKGGCSTTPPAHPDRKGPDDV